MKKLLLIAFLFTMLYSMISCSKEEIQQKTNDDSTVTFTTELSNDRIELVNQPILFTKSVNDGTVVDLEYTWVANMTPPVYNGYTLSASTVDATSDYVYVGWHARGTEYYGQVDVISMLNPDNFQLIQFGSFYGQEFNDLEVKENVNKLFLAGGAKMDLHGNSIGDNNAMALSYNLQNGVVESLSWENYLPGYSANSITYVANQTLWVSKGSQGGLTVFRDYDLDHIKLDMEVSNAKHFDATGDWGAMIVGVGFNESKLYVWDMTNLYAPIAEYTIPYDVTPQGKNSVDINGDYAYLALGNDGIVKVDLTNGNVVNQFDYENGGFCNGVTVDWRWIFAAYGSDGLFIIDKETFEVLGNWNYDGSCNYVKKVGDYLYLANGDTDGLIILKKD